MLVRLISLMVVISTVWIRDYLFAVCMKRAEGSKAFNPCLRACIYIRAYTEPVYIRQRRRRSSIHLRYFICPAVCIDDEPTTHMVHPRRANEIVALRVAARSNKPARRKCLAIAKIGFAVSRPDSPGLVWASTRDRYRWYTWCNASSYRIVVVIAILTLNIQLAHSPEFRYFFSFSRIRRKFLAH